MKYSGNGTKTSRFANELDQADADRRGRPKPPQDVIDAIAEFKLDGGFNTDRDNLCPVCNLFMPVNGRCC
jgi:hypothetical protein